MADSNSTVTRIKRGALGAPIFKPGQAIRTIDQITAAVSMAGDVVQNESATNQRLADSWLVLELADEKIQELRNSLEQADSSEARAEMAHG
jgi:hypothetical protein